jgi:hypothetical protein
MRAASLFLVFVVAKIAMVAGHDVPLSVWSPSAYLWHDALVVLVFATLEVALAGKERIVWTIYGAAVLYAAINVPVARVLSTPLTWLMWRAAGSPLADSIRYYATAENLAWSACVIGVAAAAPRVFRRVAIRPVVAALAACAAVGPVAAAHVDTHGLGRNAWTSLVATALPRVAAHASERDWRRPPFPRERQGDLTGFRGVAAGRNVVLVSLESTAAQYLGLYGAARDPTPNLSALARNALVFDNAYAVYPESIKGLFSILCSMYPAFDSDAARYADVPCRSIAETLSGHGYRTALFHSGRFDYLGMSAVVRSRGFGMLADAGDIGGNHNSSFGVDEPSTVASIVRWIDGLPPRQPFFLTYLPIAAHHPYESLTPGPFADGTEFGRYLNALHYGDESLGTLMRAFAARGLSDRTLWIVLGDHGEAFGQHDGNYGHTFQLYEENVHVPFVAAAPGAFSGPIHSANIVSLIDTAPTLLDLLGMASPSSFEGETMLDGKHRLALFFADYSLGLLGLRDGRTKFIYDLASRRAQMYDLELDRNEKTDLSARDPDRRRWYADDLKDWSAAESYRFAAHR